MDNNDVVKRAAATAKLQLEAGKNPAQVFAEVYKKFSEEFELIVKEIVRFDLLENDLKQFTKAQLQYTSIKTKLGCKLSNVYLSNFTLVMTNISSILLYSVLHSELPTDPCFEKTSRKFREGRQQVVRSFNFD